jgi:hypothetical protein
MPAIATVYTPYVAATLNGAPIEGVRKARVISTFTDPVTKIYVSLYPRIAWAEGDTLAVTTGSGTNNVLSGTAQIYTGKSSNTGPEFNLTAYGRLFLAQRYTNNTPNGTTLADLIGGPATDEDIAMAVLDVVGIPYNPADIGGTGIVRGALAPDAYTWRQGESALAYLIRLSKASLGYRMIERINGDIARVQVVGRPQVTPDFSMTEGVDIFPGASAEYDTLGKYTVVEVNGFDFGEGVGPVSYKLPDPSPAGVQAYVYSSEMIERASELDTGGGISAQNVAVNFVEPEVNRVIVHVSGVKTPRDDTFSPGQTHQITSERLDLNAAFLWLYSVTREVDEQWFTQTLDYAGTATVPGGYDQSPVDATFPAGMQMYVLPTPAYRRMRAYIGLDGGYTGPPDEGDMPAGVQLNPQPIPPKRGRDYSYEQPTSNVRSP